MELSRELAQMDAEELRDLTATLLVELASRDKELKAKQLKIDQLTHEMATLKRYRFDRRSEQMDPMQRSLLDESIDADIEAICLEIEALKRGPPLLRKKSPAEPRCQLRSRDARSATSPRIRNAAAAAASSASARM